ncbi:Aste57867_10305 [Aphanomyces stellatus]|uniref:Aste57867_10305 protein n=1 Tax=Aphanomyces stellatus TaxID=120398 RepID=A0A485KQ05_9STRA|nr:hypothetical protein As57867_010265 [Aphanomyces stellatus]VFT87179.1 Aste57867_10305 [Aphanomyces stellatus]
MLHDDIVLGLLTEYDGDVPNVDNPKTPRGDFANSAMLQLPVPPKFFPPVNLTDEDEVHLRRLAKEKLRGMQDLFLGRHTQMMNWVPCEAKGTSASSSAAAMDGPQVMKTHFIDIDTNNAQRAHASMLYRSTIVVNASFSEVMTGIASSRTDEFRKQMRGLYGTDFVDGVVLHALPATKLHRPAYFYTALKWCVLQQPSAKAKGGLGSDFCFLEYAGIHKATEDHEKMGFCIQQSVAMDNEVPDFAHYGLQRDTFQRTGILVTATARDHTVRLTAFCQIQNARLQPAHARDLEVLMYRRVAAVRDFALFLERGRLGKMQFVERWRWIPDTDRRTCAVCLKMFLFRRKHHCRQCGEVVCSMCSPHREIDAQNVGLTRVRICTICMMRARSDHAISDDQCGSSVFTASNEVERIEDLQLLLDDNWDARRGDSDSDDDEPILALMPPPTTKAAAQVQDSLQLAKQLQLTAPPPATPRPVLEFDDDDDGAESDEEVLPPPPSTRHTTRDALARQYTQAAAPPMETPYHQQHQQQYLYETNYHPLAPRMQQQQHSLPSQPTLRMPYPSSFNQKPSDLESVMSFATDDTDNPYATQNYALLMQDLDEDDDETHDNLSEFNLGIQYTSGQRASDAISRQSEAISDVITEPPPFDHHVVVPSSKRIASTPTLLSDSRPPALSTDMKARLLERQAFLQSRYDVDDDDDQRDSKYGRDRGGSFRAPKAAPPTSSPKQSKLRSQSHNDFHRLEQDQQQQQLLEKATLAFARLNHNRTAAPLPPSQQLERALETHHRMPAPPPPPSTPVEKALQLFHSECHHPADRLPVLRTFDSIVGSLLTDKENSDCICIDRAYLSGILKAYPATVALLQAIGYSLLPSTLTIAYVDTAVLVVARAALQRAMTHAKTALKQQ